MPEPALGDRLDTDTDWAGLIERALGGGVLRPVYQPIVDLRRRVVVGYEALSRFVVDGILIGSPDLWFAAAHRLGLGDRLDALTLDAALARRPDLPRNCFLTVNVDPDSLGTRAVREVLGRHGYLGGLVIEITEHRPWDWSRLAPVVRALRADGALFAVDDAGAGHSGLQQILQLRPDFLKLDRALVEGIDADEAKTALVEMVGLFAARVDAWILAEGIETLAEARRLVELQVPLAQGFLFGRPAAPWAGIDPAVVPALADFAERGDRGLHLLVDPVAAVNPLDDPSRWAGRDDRWIPVVDANHRPLGLIDPGSAFGGELVRSLVVNVDSTLPEVAHRLATSAGEPGPPVVVTDNAGRYVGLIGLRRLLRRLGDPG